jgi:DNA-binding LacI/PurR family transcriptional regulator
VPERFGTKPATLADVAAAVGLSPAAVSLALRGKVGVSEATRTRRRCRPDARLPPGNAGVARQHQKPMTIGLVIKAVHGDAPEANRFYAPVMAGIEESCRAHRMDLMLATMPVDEHYYPIEVPRIVTDRTCDGLIVVGAHLSAPRPRSCGARRRRCWSTRTPRTTRSTRFATDNVGGARTAVEHLISKGHRNIAILGTEPQGVPQHPAAAPGLRAGHGRGRPGPPLHRRPYWPPEEAAASASLSPGPSRDHGRLLRQRRRGGRLSRPPGRPASRCPTSSRSSASTTSTWRGSSRRR